VKKTEQEINICLQNLIQTVVYEIIKPMDKIFLNTAFSLLAGVFAIFALSFTGFILGFSIMPIYAYLGLFVTFLIFVLGLKSCGIETRNIARYCFLLVFIIILPTFLCALLMDPSYDGREYHQTGTILLEKGWNPIYDDIIAFCSTHFKNADVTLIWPENYVKFSEIFAANVVLLTGKIETGKVFNGISALIAFFYSYYVLSKPFLKLGVKSRAVFSFLLVYNPIVLAQFFTYYVDGLMYLYFLISLLSIVDMETSEGGRGIIKPLFFFIVSSVILMNIKLGGVLCFICIILCALIFLALGKFFPNFKIKTFNSKAFWASVLAVIFLTLLSGINPYFTNILKERHPLYPLAGEGKRDIITLNSPRLFENKPPYYKFFISLFSRTDNFTYKDDRDPKLKIPFGIYAEELPKLDDTDTRIAGFGVLFSGIFLMTLALLFMINYRYSNNFNKKGTKDFPENIDYGKKEIALILSVFIISILLNPESWWARYIPQLWAVIIFIIIYALLNPPENASKMRLYKQYTKILLFIMFINSLSINLASTYWSAKYTRMTTKAMNKYKALQKNDPMAIVRRMPEKEFSTMELSYTRKLYEAGVKYEIQNP